MVSFFLFNSFALVWSFITVTKDIQTITPPTPTTPTTMKKKPSTVKIKITQNKDKLKLIFLFSTVKGIGFDSSSNGCVHARLSKSIGKFELMFTVQAMILEAVWVKKDRCYKKKEESSLDFFFTNVRAFECFFFLALAYKYKTTKSAHTKQKRRKTTTELKIKAK